MATPFDNNNETRLTSKLCKRYPSLKGIKTGSRTARLDVLFFFGEQLCAVAEYKKCKFGIKQQRVYGSTIIGWAKYNSGVNTSKALGVPFVVIIELTDALMCWKVTDDTGKPIIPISRTKKRAQVSELNKQKILKDFVELANKDAKELKDCFVN